MRRAHSGKPAGARPNSVQMARLCVAMAAVTVLAVGFAVYSLAVSSSRYSAINGEAMQVVVAARDIAPGEVLDMNSVALAELPKSAVGANAADETGAVVGHTALARLSKGAVVDTGNISGDDSAGLSGRIEEGKLALSASVTQQTGVAGLVRQGDHVTLYGDIGAGAQRIAEGAEVLAVDSNLDAGKNDYTALTVSVTPGEAEKIALALDAGQVTFAVEPAAQAAL